MATGYKMRLVTGGWQREDPVNGVEDEAAFGVEVIGDGGHVAIVTVFGQADLHTAPELRSAIGEAIEGGAGALVIDLSEATFIDSMTLGVLLGALKQLRPSGGSVSIVCSDPHIRRIFEITLLDRVFALHETRDAALREADRDPGDDDFAAGDPGDGDPPSGDR
jgi:anti-sigma B factor antagonist